jgi:hypothetical protein
VSLAIQLDLKNYRRKLKESREVDMIYTVLILSLVFASSKTPTRVLENKIVHVDYQRIERPVAEPVSKPFEIDITVTCKNKKPTKKIAVPVCDLDVMDKDSNLSDTTLTIAHHSWDAVKSSNNPDGRNHCNNKKKLFYTAKISDLCK